VVRTDLVKKLFSDFKPNDRKGFVRVANEIIEDERKKNHGLLAEELSTIINDGSAFTPKRVSTLAPNNIKERESALPGLYSQGGAPVARGIHRSFRLNHSRRKGDLLPQLGKQPSPPGQYLACDVTSFSTCAKEFGLMLDDMIKKRSWCVDSVIRELEKIHVGVGESGNRLLDPVIKTQLILLETFGLGDEDLRRYIQRNGPMPLYVIKS
jgi:hypothetical protein